MGESVQVKSAAEPAVREEEFDAALARMDHALRAMWAGDPEPLIEMCERSDEVTLFGALGPVEQGWQAATDTWRWVGGKFSVGGPATIEHLAAAQSGDLAYTSGFERRTTSLDRGPVEEKVLRVTHIYRRSGGQWRLIHRHADLPPGDPRPSAQSAA
jgi:ketosteroid isomerase-like protein